MPLVLVRGTRKALNFEGRHVMRFIVGLIQISERYIKGQEESKVSIHILKRNNKNKNVTVHIYTHTRIKQGPYNKARTNVLQ